MGLECCLVLFCVRQCIECRDAYKGWLLRVFSFMPLVVGSGYFLHDALC